MSVRPKNDDTPKLLRIMARAPEWKKTGQHHILIAAAEEIEQSRKELKRSLNTERAYLEILNSIGDLVYDATNP